MILSFYHNTCICIKPKHAAIDLVALINFSLSCLFVSVKKNILILILPKLSALMLSYEYEPIKGKAILISVMASILTATRTDAKHVYDLFLIDLKAGG